MIFLSACPHETFFLWQYKVQLYNFKSIGINLSDVHILVGVQTGFQKDFSDFNILSSKFGANVHFYEDERRTRSYPPSIRPYLINKFVQENPQFINVRTFYHDSDIVLSRNLDWEEMSEHKVYLSDTDGYLGFDYLSKFGTTLLCDVVTRVGVSLRDVRHKKAGGAQYLFHLPGGDFWSECEVLCEDVYDIFNDYTKNDRNWVRENGHTITEIFSKIKLDTSFQSLFYSSVEKGMKRIQHWTTDMWVLQWMLWRENYDCQIDERLSFLWPWSPKESLEQTPIFHNSGVVEPGEFFFKSAYRTSEPFGEELQTKPDTCSAFYVDLIKKTERFLNGEEENQIIACELVYYKEQGTKYEGKSIEKLDLDVLKHNVSSPQDGTYFFPFRHSTIEYDRKGPWERRTLNLLESSGKILSFEEDQTVIYPFDREIKSVGLFYTNNHIPLHFIKKSLNQLATIKDVNIVASVWDYIPGVGIPQLKSKTNSRSHLNIVLQILHLLEAIGDNYLNTGDVIVYFLEHDVLYPQEHFNSPRRFDVFFNTNYIQANPNYWMSNNSNAFPLHQLSMRYDYAYDYFSSLIRSALLEDSIILEPSQGRIQRYSSSVPSVHIETGSNFTSHYQTFSPLSTKMNPYWGSVEQVFDETVERVTTKG